MSPQTLKGEMECFIMFKNESRYMKRFFNPNKTDESKYTLGIIAGVHGDEPGSIILAKRLMNYFENECGDNFPTKFSEIKILPFANIPAIINNTRDYKEMCNPKDTNLNRGWGMDDDEYNMDGIRNIIKEFVNDADVIIDLHSSPTCIPGFLIDSNQTYSDALIKWCEDSNINCMVRDCTNPTIKKYAASKGKIALTWEQSGMVGRNNYSVIDSQYIFDMWRSEIIPKLSELVYYVNQYKSIIQISDYKSEYILSKHNGIFVPMFSEYKDNMVVPAGTCIGYIIPITTSIQDSIPVTVDKPSKIQILTDARYVHEYEPLAIVSHSGFTIK